MIATFIGMVSGVTCLDLSMTDLVLQTLVQITLVGVQTFV